MAKISNFLVKSVGLIYDKYRPKSRYLAEYTKKLVIREVKKKIMKTTNETLIKQTSNST